MANTSINFTSLDFDDYKNDLKSYLKSQDLFKDYDFEGANIGVLLDVLSINTFKNAFFLNMAISEGFLDSAQLKNSVLSHAKELNYTPRSYTSSKANITVTFEASGVSQPYIIQKGQSFSSIIRNKSFEFTIPETLTVSSTNNTFTFTSDIYEGIYVKDTYIFDYSVNNKQPKFKISNESVDTSSLTVTVFEDGSLIGDTYKLATSLLGYDSSSKIYFLQTAATDGKFEVVFGDNIVGRRPKNGSTVLLDYRVSKGTLSNGASTFSINFNPTGIDSELTAAVSVTTNESASGGSEAEDLETTRFYAPRYFQTQERAVTSRDYEVLLKTKFPEIVAVSAYGGEEVSPPEYGKVYVALKLSNVSGLPDSKKNVYYDYIKARCPLTIVPKFVEAQETFLQIDSTIRYNINVTNESVERIKTLVLATISDFNTNELNDFNVVFRYSPFIKLIDSADNSIVSNITNTRLYKKIVPITGENQNFSVNFGVPIVDNEGVLSETHSIKDNKAVSSSGFVYGGEYCQLEDDGAGTIRVVSKQENNFVTKTKTGTINYDTGEIIISNLTVDSFDGSDIKIYVETRDKDIEITLNTILSIEPEQCSLTIEQVQI